jgi:hypothetical protein
MIGHEASARLNLEKFRFGTAASVAFARFCSDDGFATYADSMYYMIADIGNE